MRFIVLKNAEPISIEIGDMLPELIEKANGVEAYNAYFFLREPMYRFASDYIPSHWILWILTNFTDIDPNTPLLRLYYNGCDVAINNDGVLIFKLKK